MNIQYIILNSDVVHSFLSSQVVATNGDTHLGGEDFDQRVMEHFIKLYKKKTGKRPTLQKSDEAAHCGTLYRDQFFLINLCNEGNDTSQPSCKQHCLKYFLASEVNDFSGNLTVSLITFPAKFTGLKHYSVLLDFSFENKQPCIVL